MLDVHTAGILGKDFLHGMAGLANSTLKLVLILTVSDRIDILSPLERYLLTKVDVFFKPQDK